ncbi:MAG TPA: hypothetical protein VGM70_12250 [Pseudolysinimonas sp.]|jgi:hypothetical protein
MSVLPPDVPALSSIFRPSTTARVQGAVVIVLVTAAIALAVGSVTLLISRNGIATDIADAIAIVPTVVVAVLGTIFLVGRLSTRWVVDRAAGELRLEAFGGVRRRWPVAGTLFTGSSRIRRSDGMEAGTIRQLHIVVASRREQIVTLWRFDLRELSELSLVLHDAASPPPPLP